MDLKDKVVVITGASSGLGEALARAFAKEEASVVANARTEEGLRKVADEIGAAFFVADIADKSQVDKLASFALQKFGRIDLWVNNAGIWLPHAPVEEQDFERVHRMFEINVFGTMYGSRAALVAMRRQHTGTIVNILSTSALVGRVGSSSYCASKWAVNGFTKSLRLEAATDNISVLSVFPGGMKTHIFDEKKPGDFGDYMDTSFVAERIIENLRKGNPDEELVIKRE